MPTGLGASEHGGVMAPADVHGAGLMEWAQVAGVPPQHPLVSGGVNFDADRRWGRVVTTPEAQSGPTSDVIATPEITPAELRSLDSWRDLFNFKGSPVPWLLLLVLAVVFMVHFGAAVEVGGFGRHVKAGARYG